MALSWFNRLLSSRPRPAARRPAHTRLQVEGLEERWAPAVDMVTTISGGGPGSLAAVLAAAAPGDTIVFQPGLSGTITPGAVLTVANSVTIQGPGACVLSVSGGNANQVFLINAGVSATIAGLTITDGFAFSSTGNATGGTIDNEGNLALINDVISNSIASTTGANNIAEGGGIFSNGTLSLVNCLVSGNTASVNGSGFAEGGGIESLGPVLSVNGCNFTGNLATSAGGIFATGGGLRDDSPTESIVNTTFTNNTASVTAGDGDAEGGGSFHFDNSSSTFTNLTFSTNQAIILSGGKGRIEGGGLDFSGGAATFTNVTVTDNLGSTNGTGNVQGGGVFLDEGDVIWTSGLVRHNTATSSGTGKAEGGGIGVVDKATLSGLTVTDNIAENTGSAEAEGGGIFADDFLALATSTVSNNHAIANSGFAAGGGIFNDFGLTVSADTLANNSASATTGNARGGGLFNSDNLAVTNATLFGNSVGAPAGSAEGGGLFNSKNATLINDTLASNTATGSATIFSLGGGIFNGVGTVNLINTIDFNGGGAATDPDFSGPISATQNSLFGSNVAGQIAANGDLGGNQFNKDPLLGPLADNGGPTQTLALLPGSPAIGAGTSFSVLGDIPTTDQRGLPRQGAVDIGAFQVQPPPPAPPPATERAFVVSLVTQRVGKRKVLLVVERFADNGAVKAEFLSPFQPGKFKAIRVTPVDNDGDGVPDLLVFTAVRKGKTRTVVLPA